jgi:hypothetical protein
LRRLHCSVLFKEFLQLAVACVVRQVPNIQFLTHSRLLQ